jgi:hypothetical protein
MRRAGAVLGAATLLLTSAAVAGARPVAPATTDDFFAAAQLQPGDLPASLTPATQGGLSADDIAARGAPEVADLLASDGFIAAYQQSFVASSQLTVLTGGPAGAGAVITVFSLADGASTWNAYEANNAAGVGQQAAASSGVSLTISSSVPLALPAFGDESSAVELAGTATLGGQTLPITVDVAFVRRGAVQYTVVAAGLASQQSLVQQLTTVLDANIAAALPLVDQ